MADWLPFEVMWRNALAVVPLAVAVALICRFVRAQRERNPKNPMMWNSDM